MTNSKYCSWYIRLISLSISVQLVKVSQIARGDESRTLDKEQLRIKLADSAQLKVQTGDDFPLTFV